MYRDNQSRYKPLLTRAQLHRGSALKQYRFEHNEWYFIEGELSDQPFLPYCFIHSDWKIDLNLIASLGADIYEVGGRYGETPIHGYLSFNEEKLFITFSALDGESTPLLHQMFSKHQAQIGIA